MRKLFIAVLSVLCHASILSVIINPFSSVVSAQQKGTTKIEERARIENRLSQNRTEQPNPLATLHGRVVDAQTGEPVAKVRVNVSGSQESATTDDGGAFVLENLPQGEINLYVTRIGYGLVKRTVLMRGREAEIEIAL